MTGLRGDDMKGNMSEKEDYKGWIMQTADVRFGRQRWIRTAIM